MNTAFKAPARVARSPSIAVLSDFVVLSKTALVARCCASSISNSTRRCRLPAPATSSANRAAMAPSSSAVASALRERATLAPPNPATFTDTEDNFVR